MNKPFSVPVSSPEPAQLLQWGGTVSCVLVSEGGFLQRCLYPGIGNTGISAKFPSHSQLQGAWRGRGAAHIWECAGAPHEALAKQLLMGTDSLAGQGLCRETSRPLLKLGEMG